MSGLNDKGRGVQIGSIALALAALAAGGTAALFWLPKASRVPDSAFSLSTAPAARPAPNLDLRDVSDHPFNLRSQQPKVVVIFFGFTRCPDVCPTELFKLAQVLKGLGDDANHVQVVFITLDPERDTPRLMAQYVAAFDHRIVGLSGSRSEIDAAARLYFVAHMKSGSGDDYVIDHSTATYVIDTHGRLRLLAGLDDPVESFIHDIRLLLTE